MFKSKTTLSYKECLGLDKVVRLYFAKYNLLYQVGVSLSSKLPKFGGYLKKDNTEPSSYREGVETREEALQFADDSIVRTVAIDKTTELNRNVLTSFLKSNTFDRCGISWGG